MEEQIKKEEVLMEELDGLQKTTHQSVEVRLEGLTKIFVDKTKKETRAVDDFNVVIPAGKLIGLLGPSGCGKSTTLYMIAGLHKPTSGKIFFGEEDVTFMPPEKRGIGLVFQNYALYPHLTVKDNILFPLQNMKVPKEEALKLAQEMAELVHIGDLMERKPAQLSGGQQQRVAIARALVKKPKVLLLDEPLSNLDARLRLQTREEIRRIQKETGITTIFVTHDQEEAMSISDEIVVMNFGVKQQIDEPQNVYEEPINLFVAKFLGNPPINVIDANIENKQIKLHNGYVLGNIDIEDQEVKIGVRPEFFTVDEGGEIPVHVDMVEHIGRDTMALVKIEGYDDDIRAIVPSHKRLTTNTDIIVGFRRFFVFNANTGERIK
ncbi:MAG: ABC transporter ATP-binding protein [Acholeplasmataceae bacterium]|nr:ABC transporter ATP-binding protein [Acholeplasmataceae bacterium]